MCNTAIFFNNKIIDLRIDKQSYHTDNILTQWGNWCLNPVRCLFNGKTITISSQNQFIMVKHEEDYSPHFIKSKKHKTLLSVVASIIFLIPGLMIGSVFKGLGYLSRTMRERHCMAVKHYTPIDRTFGCETNRYSLQTLKKVLEATRKGNLLNQPTKHLIIYAKAGTEIEEDPGFVSLNPEKIILVGAKITNKQSHPNNVNYVWNADWERQYQVKAADKKKLVERSFLAQWKVKSVEEAKMDIPPTKGFFSFAPYKRVYVVE